MINEKKEDGFMLVALKPFTARGCLNFKIGDRVGQRMTYFQALKEAKRHNIGHSVGGSKRVGMKPYVEFKSSYQVGKGRQYD